jgi:CII-binding regulator of phage lambda lysogenization HflD
VKQEKDDIQAKFVEDREQIHKEKEQLLVKKIGVKAEVTRELLSMMGLEQMEEGPMESQVGKLAEAIQQVEQRIEELDLQVVPRTPQEVRYQIE